MNNRIKERLTTNNIHFNNLSFVEELGGDAVHWSEAGRESKSQSLRKSSKDSLGKTKLMSEE